jgi:endogenous inhibitor of DNA gyrase (YacG/DUF329 family)
MKTCPHCKTPMNETQKQDQAPLELPQQPVEGTSKSIPARIRFECPTCQHLEETFPLPNR